MANVEHEALAYGEQHVIHFAEYANSTAREAAAGLTSGDDHKVALQTDDHTLWVLTDYSGPTWVPLMGTPGDDTVTGAKIVDDAIDSEHYTDGSIDSEHLASGVIIPSGTKMWFYQNTAPTGWTLDATPSDELLAVKGGSQAYNANGGTGAGTWTVAGLTKDAHVHGMNSHTHTGPSHAHGMNSHTHTGPNHNHQWYKANLNANDQSYNSAGTLLSITLRQATTYKGIQASNGSGLYRLSADQYTIKAGTGATGAAAGNTAAGGTGATGAASGNTAAQSDSGITSDATWRPKARLGIICTKD